jgi:hypothetical protein
MSDTTPGKTKRTPILMIVRAVCDRVNDLKPAGELLGGLIQRSRRRCGCWPVNFGQLEVVQVDAISAKPTVRFRVLPTTAMGLILLKNSANTFATSFVRVL